MYIETLNSLSFKLNIKKWAIETAHDYFNKGYSYIDAWEDLLNRLDDLEFEEIDNERGFERDDEGLEYFDYQDFILMAFDDEWEEIIAEAAKVAVSE